VRRWFRNGEPCRPLPFDLKNETVFGVEQELFRHAIYVFIEEDGQRVQYEFRTLLPYHYTPGETYCLALVDGEHGIWQCFPPAETGDGKPAPIELMKPARWGLYQ
jgi:hypothetical protein